MKKIEGPIRTAVEEGDPYVDRPVFIERPVFCGKEPILHPQLDHYKRTPLRWMKPGPDGKLVPR
jgi:hypothetical protein